MAAALMMTACDNKQKNDGKSVESDVATAAPVDEDDSEELSDDPTGILSIRQAWTNNTISVEAGDAPGIEQLAFAFCQMYPQCETNKALMDYLASSDDFDRNMFNVDCQPRNGYIRCMMQVQTAPVTSACCWNRSNNHKLFAAYMESIHESGAWDEHLVVFYDYDPATDIMTPEPALTSMIEKRVKDADSYSVVLPEEGKDIIVYGYTVNEEEDSADSDEMKLKWNGMTFD